MPLGPHQSSVNESVPFLFHSFHSAGLISSASFTQISSLARLKRVYNNHPTLLFWSAISKFLKFCRLGRKFFNIYIPSSVLSFRNEVPTIAPTKMIAATTTITITIFDLLISQTMVFQAKQLCTLRTWVNIDLLHPCSTRSRTWWNSISFLYLNLINMHTTTGKTLCSRLESWVRDLLQMRCDKINNGRKYVTIWKYHRVKLDCKSLKSLRCQQISRLKTS